METIHLRTEKLLAHPLALLNQVFRLVEQAGKISLDYFDEDTPLAPRHITQKEDGSSVSVADRAVESFLIQGLAQILPDVPALGEETCYEGHLPAYCDDLPYHWLIDPIDGTQAFIEGKKEYTINVALIHHHHPFLGVIGAPAKTMIYAGLSCASSLDEPCEPTAWRSAGEGEKRRELHPSQAHTSGLCVLHSHQKTHSEALAMFLSRHKIRQARPLHSSLKLCLLASGKADVYPRFGASHHWDTAAGHAILQAKGGEILDLTGKVLSYPYPLDFKLKNSPQESLKNPEFIAWADKTLGETSLI